MEKHIEELKELKRVFCLGCNERKNKVSCCTCPIDARLCSYIISLNYAIDFLTVIQEEYKK